jgi:hypothetical protein
MSKHQVKQKVQHYHILWYLDGWHHYMLWYGLSIPAQATRYGVPLLRGIPQGS